MTDTFRASDGARIEVHDNNSRIDIKCTGSSGEQHFLSVKETQAAREFFQHERDEALGRWRWPENPDYVVQPDANDPRLVTVIRESVARIRKIRRNRDAFSSDFHERFGECAEAYFEAHPERKPWEDAQPGDVWVIEAEGVESFTVNVTAEFFGAVSFQTPTGRKVNMNNSVFTGFRKIWPEDAS